MKALFQALITWFGNARKVMKHHHNTITLRQQSERIQRMTLALEFCKFSEFPRIHGAELRVMRVDKVWVDDSDGSTFAVEEAICVDGDERWYQVAMEEDEIINIRRFNREQALARVAEIAAIRTAVESYEANARHCAA